MKPALSKLFYVIHFSLLLSLFSAVDNAQAENLTRGEVIEKVVCKADAAQSYALYLPTSYTTEKRWAVLYCFDPAARGVLPVKLFQTAAEKYGYIVVGSNNSRNGLGVPTTEIVKTLLQDTHERFTIDESRLCTTGFSGGARVAVGAGYLFSGAVAGVIASGGGFPPRIEPTRDTPFVFYGLAGTEDFNYPEMFTLKQKLDALAVPNRLEIYDDSHNWPPAECCTRAVEWMEVSAMRSGRRKKDQALIELLWDKEIERARKYEAEQRIYDAFAIYEAIAKDFNGLHEVGEAAAQAKKYRGSKEVKDYLNSQRQQISEQERRQRELFALTASLNDQENRVIVFSQLKGAIADLHKRADAKEFSPERLVARRLLSLLFVSSYEKASALMYNKKYKDAAQSFEVATWVSPDAPNPYYNLASAYAQDGQKRRALEALKKAVEKGFANAARIQADKELEPLREEAEFKKIIEDLSKKP